jgi:hypothetical protein
MRSLVPHLALLAPLVVACSAPVGSGDSFARDAAEGASSAAVVVFERTVTADGTAHGSAGARFLKVRSGSLDDATLRMVGASLELPALGTCMAASGLSSAGEADGVASEDAPRAVELLDVGAITVDAVGAHTTLEARALPDIVDLVTGVLYSTRTTAPEAEGLPASGTYVLRSSGSSATADAEHSVLPFAVSAAAPGEPGDLRVAGQDARAADGVVLVAGANVTLRWAAAAADPEDLVYVDVVAPQAHAALDGVASLARPDGGADVRCAFADRGTAEIPASAFLRGATAPGTSDPRVELAQGTLIVHRLHREPFQVAPRAATPDAPARVGIEAGVVRFDFSRATDFVRR